MEEFGLLLHLRQLFDSVFSEETAAPGTDYTIPSAGHCAVAALFIYNRFGGELLSATVDGKSHWFNRITVFDKTIDVDLTGDQFNKSDTSKLDQRGHIEIAEPGFMFPGTRVRTIKEVNQETFDRYEIFARKIEEIELINGYTDPN